MSLSCSACSDACWPCRSPICDVTAARRVSASRARSSRPAASACCAWPCSLAADCCSWVELKLDASAAGRHVRHPAAHLHQQLQLPLVGVVEHLARILGAVQRLVRLGPEQHGEPAHEAHPIHVPSFGRRSRDVRRPGDASEASATARPSVRWHSLFAVMNARYARPARPCRDQRPDHGAIGSVRGMRVGCWLALWLPGRGGEGAQAGKPTPLSLASAMALEAAAGMCASRLTGRRPAFGARHGVLARCASPASCVAASAPAASAITRAAWQGSSGPVTEQAGKAGAVWPLCDDEGRLSAIVGIEIWPSRGSLIRHAPRCSGNMGSGLGRGAGWGLRPARLTVTSVGLAPGQVHVSNMTAPLLLCATNQARIVHHHLAAECNHLR